MLKVNFVLGALGTQRFQTISLRYSIVIVFVGFENHLLENPNVFVFGEAQRREKELMVGRSSI